jgi:hypothetical protein
MLDILIFSSSVALGIICAIFLHRFISRKKYDKRNNLVGNVKYELNNLYFEKSVALDALSKIKQFFDEKKIDEYERDRLSRKYINMLDDYNKRVFQLNPILEAQEIYEFKKQLESILTEYTKRIDSKLASMTGYPEFKNKASNTPTKKVASAAVELLRGVGRGGVGGGVGEADERRVGDGVDGTKNAVSVKIPAPKSTSELQSAFENKGSQRSLLRRFKSSITKIGPGKFDEDKNNGNSGVSSNNIIENTPKLVYRNIKENTTDTAANTIDDEINEIHQTLSKIEPDLESISKDDILSSDTDKPEKVNIDTKEIDRIQSDILKTLKRLEDS